MSDGNVKPISFELDQATKELLEKLAGGREIRVACKLINGILEVECLNFGESDLDKYFPGSAFVAVNAPYVANPKT